jgi:hypothetical protein
MDVGGLESILFSLHTLASVSFQLPEAVITEPEAKAVAKAIANVERHYELGGVPQKVADWGNLFMVLGTVYGSRYMAWRMRTDMAWRMRTEAAHRNKNRDTI